MSNNLDQICMINVIMSLLFTNHELQLISSLAFIFTARQALILFVAFIWVLSGLLRRLGPGPCCWECGTEAQ